MVETVTEAINLKQITMTIIPLLITPEMYRTVPQHVTGHVPHVNQGLFGPAGRHRGCHTRESRKNLKIRDF